MRRIVLLFNPEAGRRRDERRDVIERVAAAVRDAGCDVEVIPTTAPGSAGPQAREACERGADVVFACGGDGTIHEVLQGMMFQRTASLGIVPLGSANALARHLRLPRDPVQATLRQLGWEGRVLPIGHVTYMTEAGESSRYFAVMAGAGADGILVYKMLSSSKERFGRLSYYVRAAILVLRASFASFDITLLGEVTCRKAVSAIAARVGDLGGAFSPLLRGGSPEQPTLRVAVVSGSARLSLSSWLALTWLGLAKLNRNLQVCDVPGFRASAGAEGKRVHVQADGEWLGRTPMSVTVVPDALRLLVPPGKI